MLNMFYATKSTEGDAAFGGFKVTGQQFGCLDTAVKPVICTWIRTNSCQCRLKLEGGESISPATVTSAASLLISFNAI